MLSPSAEFLLKISLYNSVYNLLISFRDLQAFLLCIKLYCSKLQFSSPIRRFLYPHWLSKSCRRWRNIKYISLTIDPFLNKILLYMVVFCCLLHHCRVIYRSPWWCKNECCDVTVQTHAFRSCVALLHYTLRDRVCVGALVHHTNTQYILWYECVSFPLLQIAWQPL